MLPRVRPQAFSIDRIQSFIVEGAWMRRIVLSVTSARSIFPSAIACSNALRPFFASRERVDRAPDARTSANRSTLLISVVGMVA